MFTFSSILSFSTPVEAIWDLRAKTLKVFLPCVHTLVIGAKVSEAISNSYSHFLMDTHSPRVFVPKWAFSSWLRTSTCGCNLTIGLICVSRNPNLFQEDSHTTVFHLGCADKSTDFSNTLNFSFPNLSNLSILIWHPLGALYGTNLHENRWARSFFFKGIPMSSPKEDCTSLHPGGHSVMVVHWMHYIFHMVELQYKQKSDMWMNTHQFFFVCFSVTIGLILKYFNVKS